MKNNKNRKNWKWLAVAMIALTEIATGAVIMICQNNRPIDATDLSKGISVQKVEELADLQPYRAQITDFGIRLFRRL